MFFTLHFLIVEQGVNPINHRLLNSRRGDNQIDRFPQRQKVLAQLIR